MSENASTLCLIYCRVSSAKQVTEGDGLHSQEKRCRDFATLKGYLVIGVFQEGITGTAADRPAMNAMLATLGAQSGETVVLIDDIKRFARDVSLHFDLKAEITKRGGRLESPLFHFEDSPEGKFVETVIAAQAELERNQNQRQVMNRMRSRLEQGYWVFNRVPGYKYVHERVHKKVLSLDDKWALVVQEALEGFAGERFATTMEVFRFLDKAGLFGIVNSKNRGRHIMQTHRILRHRLYTGHIEFPSWNISLRKGYHPALISLETYDTIQDKLEGRSRKSVASPNRGEFLLRNFVGCAECGRAYTGCWSKGKLHRYAYYLCYNKDCSNYSKSIPKEKMESDFEQVLRPLETSADLLELMERFGTRIWNEKKQEQEKHFERMEKRVREIEKELNDKTDKFSQTKSEVIVRLLEKQIEDLEQERLRLIDRLNPQNREKEQELQSDFRTLFDSVRDVLKSPYQTWENGGTPLKRTVAKLAFSGLVLYDRNSGFRTPNLSLPYQIIQHFGTQKSGWWTLSEQVRTLSDWVRKADGTNPQVWEEFLRTLIVWSKALQDASRLV
ncbi:MAG: recombinase family protein [Armatimonadetes bacterium]|nr:recombinase family protein [Armatimonadota bacterium]